MTEEQLEEVRAHLVAAVARAQAEFAAIQADLLGESPDPATAKIAELRARCDELGISVVDNAVAESAAAWLLGLAPSTLSNKRSAGEPPDYRKLPGRRIVYPLRALAEHLLRPK